ncbi:MAG TPA: PH domain-containing protein [Anaerolineae bacterium]|nr:PH domain-containing protein [Anaerolineae bacterium]
MGYVESLLGKNEKIIRMERQHWTTLFITIVVNVFLAAVLIVIAIVLGGQAFAKDQSSVLRLIPIVFWVALIYPLGRLGWDVLQWSAEQYLVTTHRVIQTEGIVNKKTKDSSLEKVNDIQLTQSFFGRILGYGDLEIVTGSDEGVNLLHRLNNPVTFKTALLDQKVAMGHDVTGEQAGTLPRSTAPAAEDPLKRLADLDDLRKRGAISDQEYADAKAKILGKL